MEITRRDLLKLGGGAAVAGSMAGAPAVGEPRATDAETPKRGGVFRLRGDDPAGFDPHLTQAFRTMTNLSLTHSRLLKVKAGPAVRPGTMPLEPDLAESWTQPNDTTYVFKLKRGVRWHPKPPVNGRELTADDVKYTYERFLTIRGNPNRGLLEQIEKVEVPDRHTVKITLKEPFAWFLDMVASTAAWIVPREAVERFGDLKKPEASIGTGPWMLERYDPNVRLTFVRNPNYFAPGLPYADGVEVTIDDDAASRTASWLSGKYDFAPEYGMVVRRVDLDIAKQRKPGQILNANGVNDPKLTDMIRLQRRTFDAAKRREILYEIQRYLSQQVYYIYGPSPTAIAAWEPYVKNFAPNVGHDYGGRLMAAWLDT